MERSYTRARLLVAAVALIAASGATTPSANPGGPVDEVRQMHATHGGMGMHPDAAEMDQMHAEMSARLSPEDRARHERIHEARRDLMTERRKG